MVYIVNNVLVVGLFDGFWWVLSVNVEKNKKNS